MFAVIMNGDTPFAIVILKQHRTIHAGPGAPSFCHGYTAHKSDRLPFSVKPSLYVVAIGKINLPARRDCASQPFSQAFRNSSRRRPVDVVQSS